MARSQIVLKDFNTGTFEEAGFTNLNSPWGNIAVVGQKITGSAQGSNLSQFQYARYTGAEAFSNDQYAEISVTGFVLSGATIRIGAGVRIGGGTGASMTGYYVSTNDLAVSGGLQTVFLSKLDVGGNSDLYSSTVALANGDRIGIEAEGTTIRVTKNGTPLGGGFTVTDTKHTTGRPGVIASGGVLAGDDWIAGNLVSAAVLTDPSATVTGPTTADFKVSTTSASGTAYTVATLSETAPNAAQIKAGQDHNSAPTPYGSKLVTSAGEQTISVAGLTGGLTYWGHFIQYTGIDSNIVTTTVPIYPSSYRSISDIQVAGWTPSTGTTHYNLINEDATVPDITKDTTFSTSPALSATPVVKVHGLSANIPSGTLVEVKLRAKANGGSGFGKITLLGANDEDFGHTGNITLTGTATTQKVALTTSGIVTKTKEEYWI